MSVMKSDAPPWIDVTDIDGCQTRYFKAGTFDDARKVRNLQAVVDHLKRIFDHSEEVVVEERSKNIIVEAQRDKLLIENKRLCAQIAAFGAANARLDCQVFQLNAKLDGFKAANTRLDEQVGRQAQTISTQGDFLTQYERSMDKLDTEKDVALGNAQARIKYLQGELVQLAAENKLFRSLDNFKVEPHRTYVMRPRRVEVEIHNGESPMPTFHGFERPAAVRLSF